MYNVSLVYTKRNDNHEAVEVEELLSTFETLEEAKAYSHDLHFKETEYRNWVVKIMPEVDKKEEVE